jgi:hypothetical protein
MRYVVPNKKTLSVEEMGELLCKMMEEIDHKINQVFESAGSHTNTTLVSKNPGEIAEVLPLLEKHYAGKSHDGYVVTFHEIEVVKTTTLGYAQENNLPFNEKTDQNNLLFIEERLKCIIRVKDFERWLKKNCV